MPIDCKTNTIEWDQAYHWRDVVDSEVGSTFVQKAPSWEGRGGLFLRVTGGVLIVYTENWAGMAIADNEYFEQANQEFQRVRVDEIVVRLSNLMDD